MTARLLIIVSVLLYTCDALARAQGDDTRHGAWLGVGLGYGSAGFSCDTCGRSRELGGWTFNLGLGGTPNPHVQLGVQGDFWENGLRRGRLPTISTGTVLLAYYPRVTGSAFVEAGLGLSNYALEHGTGDPLEPVAHEPSYFSGTGRGYTLGFGWEGIRVVYHYGNVGALRDPSGAMIATGWKQKMLLVEIANRAGLESPTGPESPTTRVRAHARILNRAFPRPGMCAAADPRHAASYRCGGIGHHPHDWHFFSEVLLDVVRGHGRRHGNHQRLLGQLRRNLLQHFAHHLRLHTQEHDVRALHCRAVFRRHADAQLFLERRRLLAVLHRRADALRREKPLPQIGS